MPWSEQLHSFMWVNNTNGNDDPDMQKEMFSDWT